MKILGWEIIKNKSGNFTHKLKFEMQQDILERFSYYEEIKDKIVEKLTRELYPQIKSELTNNKNIEKLINDLRLKIATEVFNKEIKK